MKKLLTSIFLVLALLATTAGTVFAQETTPIIGTVESVGFEIDPTTGETVVVLSVLDETTGESQTVKVSLETAVSLGLIETDPVTDEPVIDPITGEPVVTEGAVGTAVEIAPEEVIGGEEEAMEEEHPVGSALSEFFGDAVGADYDTIMEAHEEGVGFGVIAQALWLVKLNDGAIAFEDLMEAKQNNDYSNLVFEDGTTVDNWGDIVKLSKEGGNLGSVMSGKADSSEEETGEETTTTLEATGNGNGNNGNGHGNNGGGNGKGKGKGGGGKGKGGGRP